MKTIIKAFLAILTVSLIFSGHVHATDFSNYSTEELSEMRRTMRDASTEERAAFREEWQKRLNEMTEEERQQYMRGPGKGNKSKGSKSKGPKGNRGGGNNSEKWWLN